MTAAPGGLASRLSPPRRWLGPVLAAAAAATAAPRAVDIAEGLGQGRHGDGLLLANAVVDLGQAVFLVPLLLAAWVAAGGKFSLASVSGAVVGGYLANALGFAEGLAAAGERADLWPRVVYHGGPHVNPQYASLLLYALALAALALSALRRATVDKALMAIVAASTLGTTCLFHLTVIDGGLRFAIADERGLRLAAMRVVAAAEGPAFEDGCRQLDLTCFRLPPGVPVPQPRDGAGYSPAVAAAAQQARTEAAGRQAAASHGLRVTGLSPDLRGEQYALVTASDGAARVVLDTSSYQRLPHRFKLIFGTLLVAAHAWWVFGAALVLAWHRRRWAKRAR